MEPMDSKNTVNPYRPLGKQLKALRDRANETLAEASGAVEIDVRQLASYELGRTRPSEDVLLLLISHFGAKDDEAVKLWELAGYGMNKASDTQMTNEELSLEKTAGDTNSPILFTDVVDIVVNNYGVVMKFLQGTGPANQPNVVAKVGMSREHAKSVLHILQVTLNQTERTAVGPKKLGSPDNTSKN
jgi:transcriptional regulator with XRE-family HTH domain